MRLQRRHWIVLLVGLLAFAFEAMGRPAEGTSHWPASISGATGFQDLGKAITNDPGFPAKGTDVEKARFVFSKLPEIAKKYDLEAGSGMPLSQAVIGLGRFGSDPEDAGSLKGCTGWGNCGEWSYAFSEVLGGAGVQSRVAYGDKSGGTGASLAHGGTDTMVIIEERTPDGAISRRVFDPFRAAFHGEDAKPTAGTVAVWTDRPLTDKDKLPRDADRTSWQSDPRIKKPFIKDATSESPLPPHEPIDVQTQRLRDRRDAARNKAEEERKRKEEEERKRKEEEDKRKAEETARRKAALQGALKQAEALVAAARAAAGRAQAALAAVTSASASGGAATSTANAAQGAAQQARGAVDAARSACARVVGEGVIDAARARAEAAAGEVGSRYQEAVDLAKEACQAAGQAQKASNPDARRILATKTEALAARAQSRAASAQASAGRARTEAGQAAQHHANRQAAREANAAAKAAIAAARGQISAAEGALQSQEATVGAAQGQLGAARTAGDEVERNKAAARGVLGPFLSEPEAQMMLPVINGVVAPSIEGADQPIQQALSAIQQGRAAVMTAREQLAGWEGGLGACEALAPTDGLVQAAQAAASTAELFLSKISAAAGQASQCAGLAGGGSPGSPADVKGATEAGGQFHGQTPGGQTSGPTSGAAGGGQPIEQPGTGGEPPTGGTGGPGGPGVGQWITCYSEKTKQSYLMPYGSSCPPPHLPPPAVGSSPHDPRTPWQELVPEKGGGGGGHGGDKGGGHSKPSKGGTTGGSGPTSPPTCPPGCHIKPGTNKCHCGGS